MKKYILRYKKNLILSVIFGVIEVYFIYLYCTVSTKIIDVVLGNIEGSASKIVVHSILYVVIACLSYYISQRNGKLFTQYISSDLRHDYLEGIINTKSSSFFGKNKGEYHPSRPECRSVKIKLFDDFTICNYWYRSSSSIHNRFI